MLVIHFFVISLPFKLEITEEKIRYDKDLLYK